MALQIVFLTLTIKAQASHVLHYMMSRFSELGEIWSHFFPSFGLDAEMRLQFFVTVSRLHLVNSTVYYTNIINICLKKCQTI